MSGYSRLNTCSNQKVSRAAFGLEGLLQVGLDVPGYSHADPKGDTSRTLLILSRAISAHLTLCDFFTVSFKN